MSSVEAVFSRTDGIEPFIKRYARPSASQGMNNADICRRVDPMRTFTREKPTSIETAVDGYSHAIHSLIHPEFDAIMKNVIQDIEPAYTYTRLQNPALILTGSGLGGAFVKEIAGTYTPDRSKPQDIDMVFLADGPMREEGTYTYLQRKINAAVKDSSSGRFVACDAVNVEYCHDVNAQDKDLQSRFSDPVLTYADVGRLNLVDYFFPSYPEEVNKNNLAIVLHALETAYQIRGEAQWEIITDRIKADWKTRFSPIKRKYFDRFHDAAGSELSFYPDLKAIESKIDDAGEELLDNLFSVTKPNAQQ